MVYYIARFLLFLITREENMIFVRFGYIRGRGCRRLWLSEYGEKENGFGVKRANKEKRMGN